MPELSEEQLEEVWDKVLNSTASQRRRDMKREEEFPETMLALQGDVHLEQMKKRREMRRMIEDAPPANRPNLVLMQRFTDEIAQARRDERVNAAADAARKDADFVPYDPRAPPTYSAEKDPRLVYVRPDNVPVGANVVGEAPPKNQKKSWWSRGGGAGATVSHVALAAVVVVSAVLGSFR